MTPYARRVTLGFAEGGLVPLAGLAITMFICPGAIRGIVPQNHLFLILLTITFVFFGFPIGGAVGGASMKLGKKAAIGYGSGFLFPDLFVLSPIINLQGASGNENPFIMLPTFAALFAFGFGMAGAVGAAFLGKGLRFFGASTAGFAVGGALGGAIIVLPILLDRSNLVGSDQYCCVDTTRGDGYRDVRSVSDWRRSPGGGS
jgi:hypothetical protein